LLASDAVAQHSMKRGNARLRLWVRVGVQD